MWNFLDSCSRSSERFHIEANKNILVHHVRSREVLSENTWYFSGRPDGCHFVAILLLNVTWEQSSQRQTVLSGWKSRPFADNADMLTELYHYFPLAKVYIDKKLKRNSGRAPDDLIGDILHQSQLSKKELYAAITELQIGGVETVRSHHC